MKLTAILQSGLDGPELLLVGSFFDSRRLQQPLLALLRRWFGEGWPAALRLSYEPRRVQPRSDADKPLEESLASGRTGDFLAELRSRAARSVVLEYRDGGSSEAVALVFDDQLRGWRVTFLDEDLDRDRLTVALGEWCAELDLVFEKR